jgi:hypothetical protein
VGFVVNRMALSQVFSPNYGFPPPVIIPPLLRTHLSETVTVGPSDAAVGRDSTSPPLLQVDVPVTLQTCSFRITAEVPTVLAEVFCGFPQFFQTNSGIVQQLDHERFLPNPFQSIVC